MTRIGVLALQGDFREHLAVLAESGVEGIDVRLPRHLDGLDGLIIPGGESTTMTRLMIDYGLWQKLSERIEQGLPVLGTCAGMIVLAKSIDGLEQPSLGAIDLRVRRNAFGRQVASFEADLPIPELGPEPLRAVFIRAPVIEQIGPKVRSLAALPDGRVVAAQEGNVVVAAFHPELTSDRRFHQYFLEIVKGERSLAARVTGDGSRREANARR